MWVSIAGVGINAVLNYGLIHSAFGLPQLGFLGSAVATTITIWLTAIALLVLLHDRPAFRHFVSASRPKLPMMGELVGIGWPVAITYGVESTLFLATGLTIGVLGEASLAAHQIALNVASVAFMVPLAIGQAANVRVGYWMGAGQPLAARHAGFAAIGLGVAFMSLSGLLLVVAPHAIVGLYLHLDDPKSAGTIALATSLLGIAAIFQIVDGMRTVSSGCLRGPEGHARADDRRHPRLLGRRLPGRLLVRVPRRARRARALVGARRRPGQRGRADDLAFPQEDPGRDRRASRRRPLRRPHGARRLARAPRPVLPVAPPADVKSRAALRLSPLDAVDRTAPVPTYAFVPRPMRAAWLFSCDGVKDERSSTDGTRHLR